MSDNESSFFFLVLKCRSDELLIRLFNIVDRTVYHFNTPLGWIQRRKWSSFVSRRRDRIRPYSTPMFPYIVIKVRDQ